MIGFRGFEAFAQTLKEIIPKEERPEAMAASLTTNLAQIRSIQAPKMKQAR